MISLSYVQSLCLNCIEMLDMKLRQNWRMSKNGFFQKLAENLNVQNEEYFWLLSKPRSRQMSDRLPAGKTNCTIDLI